MIHHNYALSSRTGKLYSRTTLLVLLTLVSCMASAWEHHPLFTAPVLDSIAKSVPLTPAPAVELQEFLSAVEGPMAVFLAQEEAWARENLSWYAPRPEALDFVATGNPDDIVSRFFRAIRINPNTKTPLYFSVLSGTTVDEATLLEPEAVTLFPDKTALESFDFIQVLPGGVLNAVDIIASASNEPDYGMDTGLFEDNGTDTGMEYGFGTQAFGNPALDYGSQAPFHMGFYHESPVVFMFAGFLKESYPEYRIHLYKRLSEFAFEQGYDYWGWRFLGWGLHYVADLSMPYHTTVLPGYSTLRMLWINFLDIIGISGPADNALQLVSNRHMAIEPYQLKIMEQKMRDAAASVIFDALQAEYESPEYTDDLNRLLLAKASHDMARKLDRAISAYMPRDFVSNPDVELADRADLEDIVTIISEEHGQEALDALDQMLADAMKEFAMYGRSYVLDIIACNQE